MADPKKVAGGVVNFGVIAAFTAFASFPFAWMLITTFKQTKDLLDPTHNPFIYHSPPTLEHLRVLFYDTLFVHWVLNTLFVGVVVVLITLVLAVPAGYSLARLTGAAGEKLGIGIFLTYLVHRRSSSSRCRGWWECSASRTRSGRWCWCTRASRCRSAPGC